MKRMISEEVNTKQATENNDPDFCLDWLGYGARFWTQDRFSERYINLNPYHYVASNPIKNIDINGDYVILFTEGNMYSVMYENGKAYHYTQNKDGSITRGAEYDGSSAFVAEMVGHLTDIESTSAGRTVIGEAVGSDKKINVTANMSKGSAGGWIRNMDWRGDFTGGEIELGGIIYGRNKDDNEANLQTDIFCGIYYAINILYIEL